MRINYQTDIILFRFYSDCGFFFKLLHIRIHAHAAPLFSDPPNIQIYTSFVFRKFNVDKKIYIRSFIMTKYLCEINKALARKRPHLIRNNGSQIYWKRALEIMKLSQWNPKEHWNQTYWCIRELWSTKSNSGITTIEMKIEFRPSSIYWANTQRQR